MATGQAVTALSRSQRISKQIILQALPLRTVQVVKATGGLKWHCFGLVPTDALTLALQPSQSARVSSSASFSIISLSFSF